MYCRNCGKQIADDSKFCYSCGETVSKVKPLNAPGAGKVVENTNLPPKPKKPSSPKAKLTHKKKKREFGKLLKFIMLILLSVPVITLTVFLMIAIVKGVII